MTTLILLLIFFVVALASWFMGLWSNLITTMVVLLSGMVATAFFEPLAAYLDKPVVGGPAATSQLATYTYLLDMIAFWVLFLVTLLVLRVMTDAMSLYRVKFNIWVEMVGRSVTALWIAWLIVMICAFSLQISPLPNSVVQSSPQGGMMLGLAPDRMWISLVQSRSRGALSRSRFSEASRHPNDEDGNYEPFDSRADLVYRYHSRREKLAELSAMRVNRQ